MPQVNGNYRRPQLRNKAINYAHGWFFVTLQVMKNQSLFGAIVGDTCVLNPLGEAVARLISTLGDFNRGIYVDCFVVMPNHAHLVLKLDFSGCGGVAPRHPLGQLIGKLKSLSTRKYRHLKTQNLARDIGPKLWRENYWEKIVTHHDHLEKVRAYIANNPKRWSLDRFGPVTSHALGNLDLLNDPFEAFVASQGPFPNGGRLIPRELSRGATPPHPKNIPGGGGVAPRATIISTFTSPQERAVLARLIATKRRFIAVYPGGIPDILPPEITDALAEARALLLSPVDSGTGINKQRAIWCNEYILRRARRVWCGYINPAGTLGSLLKGCGFSIPPPQGHAGAGVNTLPLRREARK